MTTTPTNTTNPTNSINSINSTNSTNSTNPTNPTNTHTIHFTYDGHRLTGTLHLPPNAARPPVVIGCHGLLADRRSPKQIALANALGRLGVAYLRFDHRGCGDSQGHLSAEHLLDDRCRDLYHAMQTLQTLAIPTAPETDGPITDQTAATDQHPAADRHATALDNPPAPTLGPLIALFGSSFGGTVIMATAAVHPVPCLITYAAPIQSRAIEAAAAEQLKTHAPHNLQQVARLSFDITPLLPKLHHILVIHGDQDEIVPPTHASRIHQLAAPPKQLILQPGGDHRMTDAHHQARFLQSCTAWIQSCMPTDLQPKGSRK